MTWVLAEEDARSLNDAAFGVDVLNAEWIDWPGTYHNGAAGFAFADGHSEIHKWVEKTTVLTGNTKTRLAVPGSRDWQWISERTSSR
jgi:prepilin-type processing-associated H-X9-DG protein